MFYFLLILLVRFNFLYGALSSACPLCVLYFIYFVSGCFPLHVRLPEEGASALEQELEIAGWAPP